MSSENNSSADNIFEKVWNNLSVMEIILDQFENYVRKLDKENPYSDTIPDRYKEQTFKDWRNSVGELYDGFVDSIKNIPNNIRDSIESQDKKWNDWQNATPEDRANCLKNGGLPFGYNPNSPATMTSPLSLDLDNNGINTVSLVNSHTFFNLNNSATSVRRAA